MTKKKSSLKQTVVVKSIPAAELARRKAQSDRDKKVNAQRAVLAPPPRKSKPNNPQLTAIKASPKLGLQTLNRLAMSLAAPQHMLPMRLPTVTRVKTDVKRLWAAGTLDPVGLLTDNYVASTIGPTAMPTALSANQALFVLTRDPVVPGFASKFFSFAKGTGYSIGWFPLATDVTSFMWYAPSTQYWEPLRLEANSIQPGDSDTISINKDCFGIAGIVDSIGAPTSISSNLYAMRANNKFYMWHPYGNVQVKFLLRNELGANPTITGKWTVHFTMVRFAGAGIPDHEDGGNVAEVTGDFHVEAQLTVPTGHYYIRIDNLIFSNTGAVQINYPVLAFQAGASSTWVADKDGNTTANLIMPIQNTDLSKATYLLESARVNASSLLISNTAAAIRKAGSVYGMRVLGEESTFSLLTVEGIKLGSGAEGIGYRGQLAHGAYTFLEPTENMITLRDHIETNQRGDPDYDPKYQFPYSRVDYANEHVLVLEWPTETNANTGVSVMYRFDQHLEYNSNSQLATLGISADRVEEYTNATITLGAGDYFFENPSHLQQLWQWILKTGKEALLAGGMAAARHALTAGSVALGAMML